VVRDRQRVIVSDVRRRPGGRLGPSHWLCGDLGGVNSPGPLIPPLTTGGMAATSQWSLAENASGRFSLPLSLSLSLLLFFPFSSFPSPLCFFFPPAPDLKPIKVLIKEAAHNPEK